MRKTRSPEKGVAPSRNRLEQSAEAAGGGPETETGKSISRLKSETDAGRISHWWGRTPTPIESFYRISPISRSSELVLLSPSLFQSWNGNDRFVLKDFFVVERPRERLSPWIKGVYSKVSLSECSALLALPRHHLASRLFGWRELRKALTLTLTLAPIQLDFNLSVVMQALTLI